MVLRALGRPPDCRSGAVEFLPQVSTTFRSSKPIIANLLVDMCSANCPLNHGPDGPTTSTN